MENLPPHLPPQLVFWQFAVINQGNSDISWGDLISLEELRQLLLTVVGSSTSSIFHLFLSMTVANRKLKLFKQEQNFFKTHLYLNNNNNNNFLK